jgi:hypothetical protein
MTPPGRSVSAIQPANAYETLRAAILTGHSNGQPGLAIIINRGVTAWVGELMSGSQTLMPSSVASGPSIRSTAPAPTPNQLIHVLAGIIVTLATGDAPTNA